MTQLPIMMRMRQEIADQTKKEEKMEMNRKKWIRLLALALVLAMPVLAMGETAFGAASLTEGKSYTLGEMLTYAIQDEYLAQAEYKVIMDAYGVQRPFANIIKAEGVHISRLLPLFAAHSVPAPEDSALEHVVKPDSIQAAYETGVTAEVNNIAMYETFLKQDNLPDDVRQVFGALMRASQNHLRAFEQNANKAGSGSENPSNGARGVRGRGSRGSNWSNEPVQGQGYPGN